MRPRWHKVLADLWSNKVRTLLVVASIFIGVLSVGMTIALYSLIQEDLTVGYEAIHPHDSQLYTSPYNPDILASIRKIPGVGEAEGKKELNLSVKVGADWIPLTLAAIEDYQQQKMDLLRPLRGTWPPPERALVVEGASLPVMKVDIGSEVEIKLADGVIRRMPVVGVVHDELAGQGTVLGVYAYTSFDSLEWLHSSRTYSTLYLRVADDRLNKAHIEEVSNRVAEHLRDSGGEVYFTLIFDPGQRPGADQILGVTAVLGILGFLSLFLAGFLIYNTLAALLNQHIKQIGIMKSVGAKTGQIVGMYLGLILLFGLLGLVPAIPLASRLAFNVATGLGQQFNFATQPYRVVPAAIFVQLVVGLVIPVLAGIVPVLNGARVTVREAISGYGLGKGKFGRSWIDQLVEHIRFFSRPMLISLRNTFRRKSRMMLTLITLALGGAIFIGVFNLRESLNLFIEQIGKYFLSDVNISMGQSYPIEQVEQFVTGIPGVVGIEGWAAANGQILRSDGSGEESVTIIAPPANSQLIEPILLKGRWITPGDQNAIVVSYAFWNLNPDLKPGDEIKLKINEQEYPWVVVGIFQFANSLQYIGYANYDYLSKLINEPFRASEFRVITDRHDSAYQIQKGKEVEAVLKKAGLNVSSVLNGGALLEANTQAINVIVSFFLVTAMEIAMVGAIGLMGTMSMNVIERTREIGVMRAIGASNRAVLRIILVEGMLIGLLSWILAVIIAMPISSLISEALSQALFKTHAAFGFTPMGFIIWLAVVIVLSFLASYLPARNASRLTVREVLAYE